MNTRDVIGQLKALAAQRGEIETTAELDADGDVLVTCPHCQAGIYVKLSAEEKCKWVVRIPHTCPATTQQVHFNIKQSDRSPEEIIRLIEAHDEQHGYLTGMTPEQFRALRARTVKVVPKR